MTATPRYVVTASPYSTDVRPNHVRDEVTGRVVARMRTAEHAHEWASLLTRLVDPVPDLDPTELASVGFGARHEPEASA